MKHPREGEGFNRRVAPARQKGKQKTLLVLEGSSREGVREMEVRRVRLRFPPGLNLG